MGEWWPKCQHVWVKTGRVGSHAFVERVWYFRCSRCGQNGYRDGHSNITYTWVDHDEPEGLR